MLGQTGIGKYVFLTPHLALKYKQIPVTYLASYLPT